MIIKCCKDCTERYPACHDHCQQYRAEKKKNDDIVDKYRKQMSGQRQLDVMGVEKRIKNYKRKVR